MLEPIIDAILEERWRGCESGFGEVVLDVAKG